MIALLLLAAVAKGAAPGPAAAVAGTSALFEAAHALDGGRLNEAKLLIAQAVRAGETGHPVNKLIADLSFATGKYEDAFDQYKMIAPSGYEREQVCERAAISAVHLGKYSAAEPFADCAVAAQGVTWRAWNVRGVIADSARNWSLAALCYARAHQLAPQRAEVMNNEGWSNLLQGRWSAALSYFQQAVALDPASERIADNLELAQEALSADLPKRRSGESSSEWAARLNDAGVAAQLLGDRKRAVAAFTQAMYANEQWYARAANNLESAARP